MLRPHSSKSCQNTTRTRGVAAKRISASSWGQCASFRCSGHVKKHELSLQTLAASAGWTSYNTYLSWRKADFGLLWDPRDQVPRKLEGNMFAFTPWRKIKRKQQLSGGVRSYNDVIILTLNNLSRIKSRLGQVEELVCSRMKHSRLYVILLHLVLSAKSVYNF